jgi:hypothetical protein
MTYSNGVRRRSSSRAVVAASIAAAISLWSTGCGQDAPTGAARTLPRSEATRSPGLSSAPVLRTSAGVIPEVIHGCVNKSSGTIKIVDVDASCAENESLFAWNIAGPAGPPGPAGAVGPTGPAGTTNVRAIFNEVPSGTAARVFCPLGTKVISGGAASLAPGVPLIQSFPIDATGANANGTNIAGWQGATLNFSAGVQVFVICASP